MMNVFVKARRVKPTNILTELKRRNVYRAAVAYGVVAWFLTQLTTQVFPFFEIPNSAVRFVVIALGVGFPIAMLLSWVYELTPEGIVRTEDLDPVKARTVQRATGRILDFIIIGVLLLVIAMLIVGRRPFYRQTGESISQKSIAVLPFENLSEEKANAYFADGIQEEILTKLAGIGDLKVISRSSTAKYKSKPEDLKTVARELGVATVLEGSVQKKPGDGVRVNVQLLDARIDTHLWADTFDRELTDIFSVESEVARAVADQLQAKLTGTEQKAIADKPTQNTAAYDAYLRGLFIEHNEYGGAAHLQAATDYVEAVRLDPKFALAWAHLAMIRSFLYFNRIEASTNTAPAVKEAADRAMALAPEAGESWIAQGSYRYRVLRDFESALAAYQEAQKRLPSNALAFEYMAAVQRRLGRWQDAETSYKKALELDPRDVAQPA